MKIKRTLSRHEIGGLKHNDRYEYKIGFRFICKKCKHRSKIHIKKSRCTASMQFHITQYHPNLSKTDMQLQYVYGVFDLESFNLNTKTVVYMTPTEFSFFRSDPKQRDKINNTIKKLLE